MWPGVGMAPTLASGWSIAPERWLRPEWALQIKKVGIASFKKNVDHQIFSKINSKLVKKNSQKRRKKSTYSVTQYFKCWLFFPNFLGHPWHLLKKALVTPLRAIFLWIMFTIKDKLESISTEVSRILPLWLFKFLVQSV